MTQVGAATIGAIGVGSLVLLLLTTLHVIKWLDFLYTLSYIKLALTLVKCAPQVLLNYQRKSTSGWSICNVILDLAGGILSVMQIFLDCWIEGSGWSGVKGILPKLGLGLISFAFDGVFLLQHYAWYPRGGAVPVAVVDDSGKKAPEA